MLPPNDATCHTDSQIISTGQPGQEKSVGHCMCGLPCAEHGMGLSLSELGIRLRRNAADCSPIGLGLQVWRPFVHTSPVTALATFCLEQVPHLTLSHSCLKPHSDFTASVIPSPLFPFNLCPTATPGTASITAPSSGPLPRPWAHIFPAWRSQLSRDRTNMK